MAAYGPHSQWIPVDKMMVRLRALSKQVTKAMTVQGPVPRSVQVSECGSLNIPWPEIE